MTKNLYRLIQKARPKRTGTRAIDCLIEIFDRLQNNMNTLPKVNDLKAFGPKYFDKS